MVCATYLLYALLECLLVMVQYIIHRDYRDTTFCDNYIMTKDIKISGKFKLSLIEIFITLL